MNRALKFATITLGTIVGVAHIGVLGHLIKHEPEDQVQQPPAFNIPHTPYSSYRIHAGKEGYTIEYRSDDPKVLQSERSLNLDKEKRGLFGGGREQRTEYRTDQYTREGTRNMGGGEIGEVGKSGGVDAACLVADAGARSQGVMAGTAISAGVLVPAVSSIPYIGWLASGWALLLGQQAGETIGSEVGNVFNDC